MAGRVYERKKRRMPCDLIHAGKQHSGLVLDVSPGGLFIQTTASVNLGDRIDVRLSIPGEAQKALLQVEVMRRVAVPARLVSVAHGGIGVRILNAPEAYYRFMGSLGIRTDPGDFKGRSGQAAKSRTALDTAPVPKQPEFCFRVRVKQKDGPRSRVIEIQAESEEEAQSEALVDLGDAWQVLAVERLAGD